MLSLDYYKVQGQEAFRKLPSFPPPSVTIMDSLGFAAAAFLVPQAPSSWALRLFHVEYGKFGGVEVADEKGVKRFSRRQVQRRGP